MFIDPIVELANNCLLYRSALGKLSKPLTGAVPKGCSFVIANYSIDGSRESCVKLTLHPNKNLTMEFTLGDRTEQHVGTPTYIKRRLQCALQRLATAYVGHKNVWDDVKSRLELLNGCDVVANWDKL